MRDRTLASLATGWLPFLVFGVATLISAVFTRVDDGHALSTYWLIAAPLALAITVVGLRRLEVRRGVIDRNESFYIVVIVLMVGAAMLLGFTTEGLTSDVAPLFPIGVGLLAIGAFDRSVLELGTGTLILALGVVLAVTAPRYADTWAAVFEGLILIGAGLLSRPRGDARTPVAIGPRADERAP